MTVADWALVISLCSSLIALASFVWNIWSKFIYPKPRIDIGFSFSVIVGDTGPETDVIVLTATNMGPTEVTLHSALIRGNRRLFRKPSFEYGLLNPLHNFPLTNNYTRGPFSGGLPKKVTVGEQFSIYLTPVNEGLAGDEYDRVGFHDTFGRYHWASRKVTNETRERIRAAYLKAKAQ